MMMKKWGVKILLNTTTAQNMTFGDCYVVILLLESWSHNDDFALLIRAHCNVSVSVNRVCWEGHSGHWKKQARNAGVRHFRDA